MCLHVLYFQKSYCFTTTITQRPRLTTSLLDLASHMPSILRRNGHLLSFHRRVARANHPPKPARQPFPQYSHTPAHLSASLPCCHRCPHNRLLLRPPLRTLHPHHRPHGPLNNRAHHRSGHSRPHHTVRSLVPVRSWPDSRGCNDMVLGRK